VLAPLLSITGIGTFALFLWAWTGTPLATYQAQHHGWSEKTDLLAMVHLSYGHLAWVRGELAALDDKHSVRRPSPHAPVRR